MDTPARDDALNLATHALASALVAVWRECDRREQTSYRLHSGSNLSEELSLALGLAARELGAPWGGPNEDEEDDEARELLVKHRPGSWEAAHVRGLMFPLGLLPALRAVDDGG